MQINLNQENIYYELHGEGERVFLLVHNAGGSHRFFYPQIEVLKNFGRVIAIDLPGHGKSSANVSHYSINKYAEILIQLCAKLNISKVNIIGLNNGANIGIEIATMVPSLLESLILIDPPLFLEDPFVEEIRKFIVQLHAPGLNKFIEELSVNLFLNSSDKNKKIAEEAFKLASPNILASVFNNLIEWNKTGAQKVINLMVPTLCILTDEHHCSYQKLRSCNQKIEIGKVVFSRCWATLEVPEQVNAMILRFLEFYRS